MRQAGAGERACEQLNGQNGMNGWPSDGRWLLLHFACACIYIIYMMSIETVGSKVFMMRSVQDTSTHTKFHRKRDKCIAE